MINSWLITLVRVVTATMLVIPFTAKANQMTESYSKHEIKQMIIAEANRSTRVRPELALAVAQVESAFNPNAVSSKGAIGIMQIMPRTGLKVFGVPKKELFKPEVNIQIGIQFLDSLLERYRGREDLALSHYNGGSRVGAWPNSRVIPYTRTYVSKVLSLAESQDSNAVYVVKNDFHRQRTVVKHSPQTATELAFSELEANLRMLGSLR